MFEILNILLLIFIFIFLVFFLTFYFYQLLFLSISTYKGAPFVITSDERIRSMIKLARLKRGSKIADLGSGNGKILIAFAKKGIYADGYELNLILVWYSRWKVKLLGLDKKVKIYWQNIWVANFNKYGAVIVYGIPGIMNRLEKQLQKQLLPNTKIISNGFKFPSLKISKTQNGVHLYIR